MASPNAAFTQALVTATEGYSGEIADNVTKTNALLTKINKKGNKVTAIGVDIVQEIEYTENGTLGYYSGFETFDISPGEILTAARFTYKQASGAVTISGLEEIQNAGKEQIHNLLKVKLKNLDKSAKNWMAREIYSDGTGTNGKQIGGLALLVPDIVGNTVGGINSTTYAWWQNQVWSFLAKSGVANGTAPTGPQMLHAMNMQFKLLTRGTDKPDIMVSDLNYYVTYEEQLQPQQRFTNDEMGSAGFTNLVFAGNVPLVYDDVCPANHMYLLNTDYLFLRPAKGREWKPLGEKSAVNQDALVMPVVWAGNMTCSNRHLQGVITP